jgi:hypothetical protein
MSDPVNWGHNVLADDLPCQHDLDLSITEIQKHYGDKNLRQNSSTPAYHKMMQGYNNPDKNIATYAT